LNDLFTLVVLVTGYDQEIPFAFPDSGIHGQRYFN